MCSCSLLSTGCVGCCLSAEAEHSLVATALSADDYRKMPFATAGSAGRHALLCIIACQRDDACMGRQRLHRWLMKACGADIKITPWDRNSWKWKAWSLGEQIGWEMWELTTRQYFRYSCCRLLILEATTAILFTARSLGKQIE